MTKLSKLKERLISHLIRKGLEPSIVPGFIRCLAISLKLNPQVDIQEISQRMNCMGWVEAEIDADTLALTMAYFDAQGIEFLEEKPVRWFEKNPKLLKKSLHRQPGVLNSNDCSEKLFSA